MNENSVVTIKNLSKIYKTGQVNVKAIDCINLEIKKGEFVAIMGPSGSGKSTLMHLLGCLDKPTTGKYFFNQKDVSLLSDRELSLIRANKIGFVFQSYNLIQQLNVFENVDIPFVYSGKVKDKSIIINAINKVGLGHRLWHKPTELSGGEMQRVAIARAMATNPSIILADEPTGNLDHENGKAILKLFQKMNAQGITIILVTHDEFVGKHCQRIVRMRDGKILCS